MKSSLLPATNSRKSKAFLNFSKDFYEILCRKVTGSLADFFRYRVPLPASAGSFHDSKMKKLIFIALVLLLCVPVFAQDSQLNINPKQIDYMKVKIIQSGYITASGAVKSASVILSMPQEGVESRNVASSASGFSWKAVKNKFGNDQISLEWTNPSGKVDYIVETAVVSNAKGVASEKRLSSNPEYLKENKQIIFTDDMRKIAFPYENSLRKAAELTIFVNNYVDYDLDLAGQLKPSDWVLANRRGVCVEYANLLSSLLKISGIPNRYIVGYAYSSVQNKLIGHTWVEVLAADGTWIPFDPTWLQGGYIDATHIKTANGIDANQTELLTYFGPGSVSWQRDEDNVEIIDYRLRNITTISLETPGVTFDESGFIKASVGTQSCTITEIEALSCAGSDNKSLVNVYDSKRQLWQCGAEDIYWFFPPRELDDHFIYSCPMTVFDQSGASSRSVVRIKGQSMPSDVSISGPDVVSLNEMFTLSAESGNDFIFYSPNLTRHNDKTWQLSLAKPGVYKFYLYSDGALAQKSVSVIEKKEFDISVVLPESVSIGSTFIVNVTVRNLENRIKQATVSAELDGKSEQSIAFQPSETRALRFNLSAETGKSSVVVLVLSDSAASYTASIDVQQAGKKGFLDAVVDFFAGAFEWLAGLFK